MSDENSHSTTAALATLAEQIKADREERNNFRENINERLARIQTQTEKTNGRVTALENWRMFTFGAFAAMTAPWAYKVIQLLQH